MEKKYRLGYDQVFLAHPSIKLGNELLAGLSITIKYKLFDLNTNLEIPFPDKDQPIGKGVKYISKDGKYAEIGDYYMSNFLKCSFDKDYEGYVKFEEINKEKLEQMGYRLEYEISSYDKDVYTNDSCICSESENISKEEFYKILSENIKNFDNIDNTRGTQSCSYVTYLIEENEEDMKKYVVEIVVISNQKKLYLTEGSYTMDIKKAKIYRNIKIAEEKLIGFCFKHGHSGALQGTIIEIKNQEE